MTAPDPAPLILQLLRRRPHTATICPSEVARAASADDWRALKETVRQAARDLARQGRIRVLQRGVALDAQEQWRGPVRLARGPHFDDAAAGGDG